LLKTALAAAPSSYQLNLRDGSARFLDFRCIPAHNAVMRKRVQLALASLFLAVLAVAGWEILRPRELNPIVDGKPLASWLDYYVSRQSEVQREMADQALDKAGTNAIPTLLWMLRQRDSSFKHKVMELVQRQHFIKVHYIPAERRNQAAYFAFLKLGARAEAAVPALIEIYELKLSPFSRQATARSLGHIGPAAKRAIPVLLRGMADTNTLVRCDTLLALADFHAEPELVVPALTNALNDPDGKVRLFACMALGDVGRAGSPDVAKVGNPSEEWVRQTVAGLVKSLSDPDPSVRGQATLALRQIDPEAAAKAGVQ
jgi:HEAT repeat protein